MRALTVRSEGAIRHDVRQRATYGHGWLLLPFILAGGMLAYALMDYTPLSGAGRAVVLLSWAELFIFAAFAVWAITCHRDYLAALGRVLTIPPRAPAAVITAAPTPRREPVQRLAGSVDPTAPPAPALVCATGQAQTVTPAGGSIRHP